MTSPVDTFSIQMFARRMLFGFSGTLSVEVHYAVLACVGMIVGAFLNWLSDQWGWHKRFRSPWSRIPKDVLFEKTQSNADEPGSGTKKQKKNQKNATNSLIPPVTYKKNWFDFLPLVGWLTFSRFSKLLGAGFWVRPFCVEILCGFGVPFLYYWEVVQQNLSLALPGMIPETQTVLCTRLVLHIIFFSFLLIATLTDFDDFIISDLITIPGTVFGLLAGAFLTLGLLPATEIVFVPTQATTEIVEQLPDGNGLLPTTDPGIFYRSENVPLHVASPSACPGELMSRPNLNALFLALFCWWGWCFAMMNRVWRTNFGLKQAVALFVRRLYRSQSTWYYLLGALTGSLIITILWNGGTYWQGACSALFGMTVGGGIIWTVRIVAAWALRLEAMGFGDVTFMAMIGAFLGWQPCLFIFFLAPIAGLVIGGTRFLLGHGHELPYGPYLALATVVVVIFWPYFWLWSEPFFEVGWLIPALMLFCAVMLVVLLSLLAAIKRRLRPIVLCLLCFGLMAEVGNCASSDAKWCWEPYSIGVFLTADVSSDEVADLERDLAVSLKQWQQNWLIGACEFQIETVPGPLRTAMLAQLDRRSASQADEKIMSTLDTLAKSELQEQITFPENTPPLIPKEWLQHDKLFFVTVTRCGKTVEEPTQIGWSILIRELDVRTLMLSDTWQMRLTKKFQLPEYIFCGITETLTPLAKVVRVENDQILLEERAGELLTQQTVIPTLTEQQVLVPIQRIDDRDGYPRRVKTVEWSYLAVEKRSAALVDTRLITGLRDPISSRQRASHQQLALLAKPRFDHTTIKLASYITPDMRIPTCDVLERVPEEKRAKRIAETDSRGEFQVDQKPGLPVRLLFIKNGANLLARIPVMPGLIQYQTAQLPLAESTLHTESIIIGIQEQILDAVGQRQILITQALAHRKKKDRNSFNDTLIRIQRLKSAKEFETQLGILRYNLPSDDPVSKRRIENMLAQTRQMANNALPPINIPWEAPQEEPPATM